jgi:hypothetical protein
VFNNSSGPFLFPETNRGKNVLNDAKIRLWRIHQAYLSLVNDCIGPVIYPVIITSWSILIIIGVYTGMRLYGIVPFPMYILFVLLAMDGLFADVIVFKLAGDVHQQSLKLLGEWKTMLGKTQQQRKFIRKQLKSCNPLRIKLGSSNYIDICTPLVILDLCLDQIVTLLIAS